MGIFGGEKKPNKRMNNTEKKIRELVQVVSGLIESIREIKNVQRAMRISGNVRMTNKEFNNLWYVSPGPLTVAAHKKRNNDRKLRNPHNGPTI